MGGAQNAAARTQNDRSPGANVICCDRTLCPVGMPGLRGRGLDSTIKLQASELRLLQSHGRVGWLAGAPRAGMGHQTSDPGARGQLWEWGTKAVLDWQIVADICPRRFLHCKGCLWKGLTDSEGSDRAL